MTREEILKMEAGTDLDKTITHKVISDDGFWHGVKPYSTDIAAAWEVVEKMRSISEFSFVWHRRPMAIFDKVNEEDKDLGDWVGAETAPLAICRAALLATLDQNHESE